MSFLSFPRHNRHSCQRKKFAYISNNFVKKLNGVCRSSQCILFLHLIGNCGVLLKRFLPNLLEGFEQFTMQEFIPTFDKKLVASF